MRGTFVGQDVFMKGLLLKHFITYALGIPVSYRQLQGVDINSTLKYKVDFQFTL